MRYELLGLKEHGAISDLIQYPFSRAPASTRRGIPFYYEKSEAEFRADVYERYDELVMRQTALHLADELHGGYPFEPLLAYVRRWLPPGDDLLCADAGCSVGRLAAEINTWHPGWEVHGFDLSYQMVRQANDYWVKGEQLTPNLTRQGWGTPTLSTTPRGRLHFALAKAEDLPFADACLDVLVNTFLIDRVPQPTVVLEEFKRVLKPGGRLITVNPLNFLTPSGWRDFHPPVKLLHRIQATGWEVLDWADPLSLVEPMDSRGNALHWRGIGFVLRRR